MFCILEPIINIFMEYIKMHKKDLIVQAAGPERLPSTEWERLVEVQARLQGVALSGQHCAAAAKALMNLSRCSGLYRYAAPEGAR